MKLWSACQFELLVTVLSMFPSIFACKSLFSVMNFIKSFYRSNLTDESNSSCMSLKVPNINPM